MPSGAGAVLAALSLIAAAPMAHAAATVHRFNFEMGAGATQIAANNYNQQNEFINRNFIEPRGLQGFERLTYSFMFDGGFRFFLKPSVAVRAAVGQMRNQTKREYLPGIRQDIQLRSEIFSVPINLGADYYFAPYNQGDFQARAFVGGGLLNSVQNRVVFQSYEIGTDPGTTLFGVQDVRIERDAPGWYGELGVHMFFALRYSVVINGYYRSAKAHGLVYQNSNTPFLNPSDGRPFDLDLSGIGGRGALLFGF